MATWKKLTEKGEATFVNLDLAYCIQPESSGACLRFVSDPGKAVHVSETPNQILMAPALRFNTTTTAQGGRAR